MRDLGTDAYSEARWREHDASCDAMAKDWNRVALAVARKTGKRVGLDTSARMAWDGRVLSRDLRSLDELRRTIYGR